MNIFVVCEGVEKRIYKSGTGIYVVNHYAFRRKCDAERYCATRLIKILQAYEPTTLSTQLMIYLGMPFDKVEQFIINLNQLYQSENYAKVLTNWSEYWSRRSGRGRDSSFYKFHITESLELQ